MRSFMRSNILARLQKYSCRTFLLRNQVQYSNELFKWHGKRCLSQYGNRGSCGNDNAVQQTSPTVFDNQKGNNAVTAQLPTYGPWKPVIHEPTGECYYWNTETNETTALNELPPGVVPPAPQTGQTAQTQGPGLGSTLLQGATFGVGAGMGQALVGSMFGGGFGSSGNDDMSGPSDAGGDDWV